MSTDKYSETEAFVHQWILFGLSKNEAIVHAQALLTVAESLY